MRAILIDPFAQAVSETTVGERNGDVDLGAMRDILQCQYVERVGLGGEVAAWLDEEGMLKKWDTQRFFRFVVNGEAHPALAGRALMLGGVGPFCRSLPAEVTLASVQAIVRWPRARDVIVKTPTIAAAEFDKGGRLVPTEEPQPLDGSDRLVWDYDHQPPRRS